MLLGVQTSSEPKLQTSFNQLCSRLDRHTTVDELDLSPRLCSAGEGGRSRRRSTRDEPLAKKELSGALAQPRREPRARAARASAAEGTVPDSPGPSGRSGRGSARPSGHEARVSRQSISITSTAESDRNSDPDTESDESDTITGLLLTRDDISEDLRSSWLFAGVTHFCNVFKASPPRHPGADSRTRSGRFLPRSFIPLRRAVQSVLHLPKSTGADKLEGVMQCPDAHPVFLAKLHCAVVAPEPVRRVDESELSRWEERVKRAWGSAWREHIEEDIFHGKSYAELTPGERCALLYVLCEHRAANCPLLRDHMAAERRRSFSRVRQSAVSRPDSGYDSDLDSSLAPRSRGGASEDDGASGSGAGRCLSTTQMVIGEDSQRRQYLRLGDNECWVFRVDTRGPTRGKSGALSAEGRVEVVATSAAECTEMAEQMKRSGAEGELRKSLLDVVVPSLEALEAAVQRRLQHAALVEAAPGKRSGRLARVRQEAEEREREMRVSGGERAGQDSTLEGTRRWGGSLGADGKR